MPWNKFFSELRVVLRNDSNVQISNIDFLMRTDTTILGVGFDHKFSQCSAAAAVPGIQIVGPTMTRNNPDGTKTPGQVNQISNIFRIKCENSLAPHDDLQLIVVGVGLGKIPLTFRTRTSWLTISGTYEAYGRQKSLTASQCLIGTCSAIKTPGTP